MTVKIIYQSKRDACFDKNVYYYPEDGYTPADRVEKIKAISEGNFSKDAFLFSGAEAITFVTACPYVTEAILKYFKKRDEKTIFEFEIDGKQVDGANEIFRLLGEPMRRLSIMQ